MNMGDKLEPLDDSNGLPRPRPEAESVYDHTDDQHGDVARDTSEDLTLKIIPDHSLGRTIAIGACTTSTSIVSAMAGQAVLLLLPSIGDDLAISQHDLTWILNSYVLPYVSH
jgi:hypothetical protein